MGRTDCPARMDYERALVELARFHRERNGALSECRLKCAQNTLDIADIVREGIYHQLRHPYAIILLRNVRSRTLTAPYPNFGFRRSSAPFAPKDYDWHGCRVSWRCSSWIKHREACW